MKTEGKNLNWKIQMKKEQTISLKKLTKMNWLVKITKRFVWFWLIFKYLGRDSISAFAFLVVIPIGITSSAVRLKIWAITAAIKDISQ